MRTQELNYKIHDLCIARVNPLSPKVRHPAQRDKHYEQSNYNRANDVAVRVCVEIDSYNG